MREEGIVGLRLSKLLDRLGVTTGSFYHHFEDMDDYLTRLAEYFSVEQVNKLAEKIEQASHDPVERIINMARLGVKEDLFSLDAAMRVWAASDKRAAAAMVAVERRVLSFLSAAFEDLGFETDSARFRAKILLSANVTTLHSVDPAGRREFLQNVLGFLVADDAKT